MGSLYQGAEWETNIELVAVSFKSAIILGRNPFHRDAAMGGVFFC